MKLVTGIEAIQSGKPWKHHSDGGWIEPETDLYSFTPRYLMLKEFIIKEEPREFWIRHEDVDHICKHCGIQIASAKVDIMAEEDWIRVREVEK